MEANKIREDACAFISFGLIITMCGFTIDSGTIAVLGGGATFYGFVMILIAKMKQNDEDEEIAELFEKRKNDEH